MSRLFDCLFHTRYISHVLRVFKKIRNHIHGISLIFYTQNNHGIIRILKSSKALTAIRLIHKFFTTPELLQLVTSNFYSVLYYNSEIWHLQSLKCNLKNKLLSSSAKAIKMCVKYCTNELSFVRIHEMFNRATPERYLLISMPFYCTNFTIVVYTLLNGCH